MNNPYRKFAADAAGLVRSAKHLPLGGLSPLPRPSTAADAPKVLIFSPHPDDECIIGALPLRLMRESGWRVVNVAVTQGSNKARQAARLAELRQACEFLGFELLQTAPAGLERVNPKVRAADPEGWAELAEVIAEILQRHQPRAILFPHDRDWNSTHIGTHWLVADALARLSADFTCFTVETEFWGQCDDPNLMVESSPEDVGDLLAACSFHVGEVQRNPYHVLTPAWMMDNVRRGGELVGGQGGAAPDMVYATLYRLRQWRDGTFHRTYAGGKMLPVGSNPAALLG